MHAGKKKMIQKAIEYHDKALQIAREREDKETETTAYLIRTFI